MYFDSGYMNVAIFHSTISTSFVEARCGSAVKSSASPNSLVRMSACGVCCSLIFTSTFFMFFCGVSTRRGLDRWSALELSDQRETCGDTWMNYRTVYRQHGGTRPMSKTHDSKPYCIWKTGWLGWASFPTDTNYLQGTAAQGQTYMNEFM